MGRESLFIVADRTIDRDRYPGRLSSLGYRIVGSITAQELHSETFTSLPNQPDALFLHAGTDFGLGYDGMSPFAVAALWHDQQPGLPIVEVGLGNLHVGDVFIRAEPQPPEIINTLHGVFGQSDYPYFPIREEMVETPVVVSAITPMPS